MAEETVADYDVRSPASRTLLTVISTIVTVLLLGGFVVGASFVKRDTRVATADVELGELSQLVINAGSANVRLVEGEEGMVRIRSRITSGLQKTDYQLGRRGNEIKIVSSCKTWLSPGCGVSTTLEVPKGMPIVVKSTPLRTLYLAAGSGYVQDGVWGHGYYQGPLKVEGIVHDLSDPEVRRRYAILNETLSRFELHTGEVGYGMHENMLIGIYRPTGFLAPDTQAP